MAEPQTEAPPEAQVVDIEFDDYGSVVVIIASTEAGHEWLLANVPDYAEHSQGEGLACERRMVYDIYEGAQRDGCTVVQVH